MFHMKHMTTKQKNNANLKKSKNSPIYVIKSQPNIYKYKIKHAINRHSFSQKQ